MSRFFPSIFPKIFISCEDMEKQEKSAAKRHDLCRFHPLECRAVTIEYIRRKRKTDDVLIFHIVQFSILFLDIVNFFSSSFAVECNNRQHSSSSDLSLPLFVSLAVGHVLRSSNCTFRRIKLREEGR